MCVTVVVRVCVRRGRFGLMNHKRLVGPGREVRSENMMDVEYFRREVKQRDQ